MCGFCGLAALDGGVAPSLSRIEAMSESLAHRGPDDDGLLRDGPVALGFRRLSIIDLSRAGHQPMATPDESVWIVFNGEVYNFRAIRAELERDGIRFQSGSDTEVVLHAYQRFGKEFVHRLDGMFALAIWDRRKQYLLLARDRMGVKPLYVQRSAGTLAFASEAKALVQCDRMPNTDEAGILNIFVYGHAVGPTTVYEGVRKLPPGHLLEYDNAGVRISQWWRTPRQGTGPDRGLSFYAGEARRLLRESVSSCLVADVPLGVFLSGGIDSGAIAGVMARDLAVRPTTFSLGFDCGPEFNELDHARLVSRHLGTDHHEILATRDDLVTTLETLAWHFDEPFADPAAVPVYLLSRLARRHVKVVLTGEGGDEIFGGYRRVAAERLAAWFHRLPKVLQGAAIEAGMRWGGASPRLQALLRVFQLEDGPARLAGWHQACSPQALDGLLNDSWREKLRGVDLAIPYRSDYLRSESSVDNKLYSDLVRYLPDTFLEKTDKASMAVGLEARVPFLDRSMVEFAATIPSRYKTTLNPGKVVLRTAVADLLPESILARKKQGFAVPVVPWFDLIRDYAEETLLGRDSAVLAYCQRDRLERLLRDYRSGAERNGEYLWVLLSFELWHRAFRGRKVSVR